MFSIINDQAKVKNELIHLEGRYNQVQSETIKGIISYETRTLQLNRIRESAIQMIVNLEYKDLNPGHSSELKEAIDVYQSSLPSATEEVQTYELQDKPEVLTDVTSTAEVATIESAVSKLSQLQALHEELLSLKLI